MDPAAVRKDHNKGIDSREGQAVQQLHQRCRQGSPLKQSRKTAIHGLRIVCRRLLRDMLFVLIEPATHAGQYQKSCGHGKHPAVVVAHDQGQRQGRTHSHGQGIAKAQIADPFAEPILREHISSGGVICRGSRGVAKTLQPAKQD